MDFGKLTFIQLVKYAVVSWIIAFVVLGTVHHFCPTYFGTLGDSLGVINSLFTFLAFTSAVFSIYQQNGIISKQEAEIKEQKNKAKEEEQERKVQRFEDMFFQMLKTQREIALELDVVKILSNGNDYKVVTLAKGRECLKHYYHNHFKEVIVLHLKKEQHPKTRLISKMSDIKGLYDLPKIIKCYEAFFRSVQNDLGHYFRHLYRIAKYLHEADYIVHKKHYAGLMRAQLSSYEMIMLFYNGLSEYGAKFRPMIIEFELLKGIDERILVNQETDKYHINSYDAKAFGELGVKPQPQVTLR